MPRRPRSALLEASEDPTRTMERRRFPLGPPLAGGRGELARRLTGGQGQGVVDRGGREVVDLDHVVAGVLADDVAGLVRDDPALVAALGVHLALDRAVHLEAG